jgi:hypothetical protein
MCFACQALYLRNDLGTLTIVSVKRCSYPQDHFIGSLIRFWHFSKLFPADAALGQYGFSLLDVLKLQISIHSQISEQAEPGLPSID